MTPLDKKLNKILARCEAATPGWRAGRPDMQSFTIQGIPFKNLYCDAISQNHEAAIIYGDNSINDSQFFTHARTDLPLVVNALKKAVDALDTLLSAKSERAAAYEKAARALTEIEKMLGEE